MTVETNYFVGAVSRDLFRLFCGDLINSGSAREVYACEINPNWVVKFEVASQSFQNIFEFDTWQWVNGLPKSLSSFKGHFAPCHFISPCGSIMIQERTTPLPKNYKLPAKLPAILGDTKRPNFGLLNGKLVCHDYGTANVSMQHNKRVARACAALRKVEWAEA